MSTCSSYDGQLVAQVMGELTAYVTDVIHKQGGNFWNGGYTVGTPEQFCDALRIEIEVVDAIEAEDSSGEKFKVLAWFYQPTLRLDTKRNAYVLQIPRSRLLAHGPYKLYSYALRALADYHLRERVVDAGVRKDLAWEFCDRIRWQYNAHERRMRTPAETGLQLETLRSSEQMHAEGVALSQVAAYLARARPDMFSFSVFYMKNMREILRFDTPTDCELLRYRELGHGQARLDVMVNCHCAGQIDIMAKTNEHAMIKTSDGCEHFVISDTPLKLSDYIPRGFGSGFEGLLEVSRTVLFTMAPDASWSAWGE